jgi:NADPH:quinone reductase-like Zn-dependent oxidoreductase
VVPQHTVFPIPSCLDFHTAAALGVAGLTAAMTLWKWLRVPIPTPMQRPRQTTVATTTVLASNPPEEGRQVMLVWGGSTATGQFAVQLATRAGFEVIAVCSEATAPLVRSLGAAHVVTYTHRTDTQVIDEILHLAGNRLTKAVDLVGSTTTEMVLRVIASSSGRVDEVDFAPLACMSKGTIVPTNVKVHTVEMKQFVLDQTCAIYGERLNQLIEDGLVRTPPISVLKGGLGAVEGGLRRVKEGNLEGRKLVVSLCP